MRRSIAAMLAGAVLAGGCATAEVRPVRDDAAIARDVRLALLEADVANVRYWNVDARQGVVYIVGTVGSPVDGAHVDCIARGVPGVRDVVTTLLQGPWVWTKPSR
jgi:osmotically-inducible protein OsmY